MNDARSQSPHQGRVYGGVTPSERAAQRRARFLEAGIELFGTTGYRATTVRALCRQAGLTDRYFYESFGDQESLLMAVYTECIARLDGAVDLAVGAHAHGDPETLVRATLDAFFRQVEGDPRVARIVWLEVLGVSESVDRLYYDHVLRFAQKVEGLTHLVRPKVELPRAEKDALSIALVGAISQSAMYWLLSGYRISRRTVVAANTRIVLGLIASPRNIDSPAKHRSRSP